MRTEKKRLLELVALLTGTLLCAAGAAELLAQPQTAPGIARVLGTIQNISGKTLTIISDSGVSSTADMEDDTKILQIEPGKTDLKDATQLSFAELQTGDRVLVRGTLAEDGKTLRAASVVAIKKSAIASKQAKERAEWQRGVGGLVKSVDPAAQTISITTNGLFANKEVLVHLTPDSILRRYASDSTLFDAAKIAPFSEIHSADQLRARGTRTGDGKEFDAVEIVSGTFRSIAGAVLSTEAATGTLVVQDLASKSAVTLKITGQSQMRKLPAPFAEGLAARLKNTSGATGQNAGPNSAPAVAQSASGASAQPGQNPRAPAAPGSGAGGAPGARGNGGDFQQMIANM